MIMMTVDELPKRFRALYRPGDPLPTWNDPHIVNTWGWPRRRREHFERYIEGEYLGSIDEVPDDDAPSLAPLEAFDHPNLKRRTSRTTEAQADRYATFWAGKSCAGLAHQYRIDGATFRRMIQRDGVLTEEEAATFRWALSGIWEHRTYTLVADWRLSIYELARLSATSFNGTLLAGWLNLWAHNPGKPIPEGDDLTNEERARHRGYIVTPIDVFDATTLRQVMIVHHEPEP